MGPCAHQEGIHMTNILWRAGFAAAMAGALVVATAASSQTKKKPEKPSVGSPEVEIRRSVFSGNELRVYPFYSINSDCTSATADVRVVKAPANGDLAFREARSLIELVKGSQRAHCNRKPVDSIVMFYTSREDF